MNYRIFFKTIALFLSICKTVLLQDSASIDLSTEHTIPCEEGWVLFGQNCYRAVVERDTWAKASAHCVSLGGHLVSIHSKEEHVFITVFMLSELKTAPWIGLHDSAIEGKFIWNDGSEVNYTHWSTGQPDNRNMKGQKENCGEIFYTSFLSATGTWNDATCSEEKPYICKKETNEALSSPDPLFCSVKEGGGWKLHGTCYNLVHQNQSWYDAEQYCRDNYKGHLVTISDSGLDWFLNYMLQNYRNSVWIGIKLRDQRQQKWVSGWHVAYNFLPHEITSTFIEDTCILRSRTKPWLEMPCNQKYEFICESSKENPIVLNNTLKGLKCPESSKDWRDLDGEFCYYFDTIRIVTWFAANKECSRRGGTLASIHSQEESDILQPFVERAPLGIFIGLNTILSGGSEYMWTDGTQVDYTNWNVGEPNSHSEKCVEVNPTGMRWNDISCNARKYFICSAKKVHPQDIGLNGDTIAHTVPCEEGWIIFGNNCYKAVLEHVTWPQAATQCSSIGGHLVSIHSKDEQDFVVGYILSEMKAATWIGLHDTASEGNFVWEDGSNVNFTHWSPGEPSGIDATNTKEDCGNIYYRNHFGVNGDWNDVECSIQLAYICKKKRNEALSSEDPLFRYCSIGKEGGWKYKGACYKLVNQKKSWQDAEQFCKDNFNGHLVTISDIETEWFLTYALKEFQDSVWIGIKLRNQFQQKWVSGWHVTHNCLPSDIPSTFTEGICVLRSQSMSWIQMPCNQEYQFICESSKENPIILKNSLKGGKCPDKSQDWRDLDGDFCYHFNTTVTVTWFEANKACARRGGTLVSIHSEEEVKLLQSFLVMSHSRNFIGLNSILSGDNEHMWTDGTQFDYTYWNYGEPSRDNEKCVELFNHEMRWNDISCDQRKGFICSARKVLPFQSPSEKLDESQDAVSTNIMAANAFMESSYCWCFQL